MIYFFWALVILLTSIIKGKISFFGVPPNFASVLVYYVGMRNGERSGVLFGSLIGSVEDSLSGALLGPNLLSKGIVGYFSSLMSGSFFRWTPLLGAIGISLLTTVDNTLTLVSRSFFDRMPVSVEAAVFITAIQSLINAPLGIFLKPKNKH